MKNLVSQFVPPCRAVWFIYRLLSEWVAPRPYVFDVNIYGLRRQLHYCILPKCLYKGAPQLLPSTDEQHKNFSQQESTFMIHQIQYKLHQLKFFLPFNQHVKLTCWSCLKTCCFPLRSILDCFHPESAQLLKEIIHNLVKEYS